MTTITDKYQTENGTPTDSHDPARMIWYGPCGYWTDDWTKLASSDGLIPLCPRCGAPGFQTTYGDWIMQARAFESKGNADYVRYLKCVNGKICPKEHGTDAMDSYRTWLRGQRMA